LNNDDDDVIQLSQSHQRKMHEKMKKFMYNDDDVSRKHMINSNDFASFE